MTERTHPTQQDEHLRRAVGPTDAGHQLLRLIAHRLRTDRSGDPMRKGTREALALRYAENRFGINTATARAAEAAFLALAPRVTDPITRGEYALLLDQAIRSAR
ncbi:hypothetical protein [Streptomyces sp. NPDC086023]|uniref:hypothetical protein n=1 Tax=Streptomyces sp. NPDC086023 TaxID=3365746 RepID=UPI0037D198D6